MPIFKDVAEKSFYTNVIPAGETAASVTVRFNRFTRWGVTGYQAGQHAGFSREVAEEIVSKGLGEVV